MAEEEQDGKHHFKNFIAQLIKNLDKWIELGTNDGLIYVSAIKEEIEKNRFLLKSKNEQRILLNTLDLLFENSNWEKVTALQLKALKRNLQKFKDGEIDNASLKKFSRNLYNASLSLLSIEGQREMYKATARAYLEEYGAMSPLDALKHPTKPLNEDAAIIIITGLTLIASEDAGTDIT